MVNDFLEKYKDKILNNNKEVVNNISDKDKEIEKLKKEINDLKEKYENNYDKFIYEPNIQNEVNINYCVWKIGQYSYEKFDYSIKLNEYTKISELKKKIKEKCDKIGFNHYFIFCGKEMNDNLRIKDYQFNIFKNESINI